MANRMVVLVSRSRHIKDKNMASAVCSSYQVLSNSQEQGLVSDTKYDKLITNAPKCIQKEIKPINKNKQQTKITSKN